MVNTTIVKLWYYKSNNLPKNGLPTRAWRRQPSHQLDKVYEGRRPEHLSCSLNSSRTILNLQLRPSIYMGLFPRNVWQIALNPTKNLPIESLLSPHIRVVKALLGVSQTSARIAWNNNISLWRHNGVPWDNGESIAAHSNAIPRTMDCITI